MIQMMLDDVGPEADVMAPEYLRRILREGVAALITEDRTPVVLIAQTRVAECDLREPALANVSAVGSRNAQNFQADVLPEVGACRLVMAIRDREVTVNEETVAERPCVTHGSDIRTRNACAAAAITDAGAAGRAERELPGHVSVHVTELEPDLVVLSAVPIDLRVVIVTIKELCAGGV